MFRTSRRDGDSNHREFNVGEADITKWIEYFCAGAAEGLESVRPRAQEAAGSGVLDQSIALRRLDPRKRKALELFRYSNIITSRNLETLFGISQRASRNLLSSWVRDGFVIVTDPAKKTRRYGLNSEFASVLQ